MDFWVLSKMSLHVETIFFQNYQKSLECSSSWQSTAMYLSNSADKRFSIWQSPYVTNFKFYITASLESYKLLIFGK